MVRQDLIKVTRTFILLFALLVPSTVFAQQICPPQDYDSITPPNFECPSPEEPVMVPDLSPPASIPVRQGESVTAPWDGALVHRNRLLELGLRVQGLRRLRWVDRLRLQAEYDIEQDYAEELCTARVGLAEAQRDAYQEQLLASEARVVSEQAWYRSWWFGVVIGVLATGGVVALTAYALSSVN